MAAAVELEQFGDVGLVAALDPGDSEVFQAVFVGGPNMPTRVRVFVDYLVEQMRG